MSVKVWTAMESELAEWHMKIVHTAGPTLTLRLANGSSIEFDREGIVQMREAAQKILDESARIEGEIEDHAREVNAWLDKAVRP